MLLSPIEQVFVTAGQGSSGELSREDAKCAV